MSNLILSWKYIRNIVMNTVVKVKNFIKDLFFPKKCIWCNIEWFLICPLCLLNIPLHTSYCYWCKEKSEHFLVHDTCHFLGVSQVIVCFHYKNNFLKKIIHDGKFYWKKELYKEISYLMSQTFLKHHKIEKKEKYIVLAPPMHFLKKWKRGYNHSELLAQYIAENLWIEFRNDILVKNKITKPQSHLSREQRKKNLQWSLKWKKDIDMSWKIVILIDDVISTGSTLWEMIKILKVQPIHDIILLTIASD